MNRLTSTLLTLYSAILLLAAPSLAKTHKTVSHKSPVHKSAARKSVSPRARSRTASKVSRRSSRTRHGRYSSRPTARAASWRNRQLAPSADRYREIQGALASKGYLKSAPTGAWDSESQDALKRFQADQNIQQTGKVNSLSLIALGLGPEKHPDAPEPPASPVPAQKP